MGNTVTVVDYGAGNIGSVMNMYKRIGVAAVRGRTAQDIASADRLLLPGVGAFDHCIAALKDSGLTESLTHAALTRRIPVLGICVGFQMLFSGSEEGSLPGLGWLDGKVVRFDEQRLGSHDKIPHMGWEEITLQAPHPLLTGFEKPRFYFVHSYHAVLLAGTTSIATCHYGYDFCCAASKDNIAGVQFHPEKSHRFGMTLLRNFAAIPVGAS